MKLLFYIFLLINSLLAQKITIYTEEYPPYNFTEKNKIVGVSAEVVRAVMDRTGLDYEIISLPWTRAYTFAKRQANTLIFSISYHKSRQNHFHWIGEITPTRHLVYALKNRTDINIAKLQDMRKYKIGTSSNDIREIYLISKGFPLRSLQKVSENNTHLQNLEKLKRKRIDLWPASDALMHYLVKGIGDKPNELLQEVYELSDISKTGYFIAANLSTDKSVLNKIKEELEEFKKSDEYRVILQRWGL